MFNEVMLVVYSEDWINTSIENPYQMVGINRTKQQLEANLSTLQN